MIRPSSGGQNIRWDRRIIVVVKSDNPAQRGV